MSELSDLHDSDLAEIIAEAGQTFSFSGSDFACITTDKRTTKQLEADGGGFLTEFDLQIVTRAVLFDTMPANGQQVTIDGQLYRISETRLNFTGKILTLGLMTINR